MKKSICLVVALTTCAVSFAEEPNVIDLGLRAKWATANLGAIDSTQFGNYYAWGETETKSKYSSDNYKHMRNDSIIKYYTNATESEELMEAVSDGASVRRSGIVDNKKYLELADDAAYSTLGENWRIPNRNHINELIALCTWETIFTDSVCGYKVTGPNGNSIFLPAAGFIVDTLRIGQNIIGSYWINKIYTCKKFDQATNMLNPYVEVNGGSALDFDMNSDVKIQSNYCTRVYGCPIRPVKINPSIEQLSQDEWKLFQFMRENPSVPINSIPTKMKTDVKIINSCAAKLKKLKLAHWEGNKTEGKWILVEW